MSDPIDLTGADATPPPFVRVVPLTAHRDPRGSFTEVFRSEWGTGVEPVQWNLVDGAAGSLRGVHVHPHHDDYVVVAAGRLRLGLADLRPGSPTAGALVELRAAEPCGVLVPHGVAHGFHFPEAALVLVGASHAWDPADELGCRWDDPGLGIPWGPITPRLSARDRAAGDLAALRARLALTPLGPPPGPAGR